MDERNAEHQPLLRKFECCSAHLEIFSFDYKKGQARHGMRFELEPNDIYGNGEGEHYLLLHAFLYLSHDGLIQQYTYQLNNLDVITTNKDPVELGLFFICSLFENSL